MIDVFRKLILKTLRKFPFPADCISGWKMYNYTKTNHGIEQDAFVEAFYGTGKPYVLGGPFKGMLYENRIYFGPVTPRWIGSYEKELIPIINGIHGFAPEQIIDIGAAEGYYSTGLALMFPSVKVISYETNPLSIWQQLALRRLNKTGNLLIRRYCSQKELCRHGKFRNFILSDIEGCELDLFTDEVVSCLGNSMVLIELHQYKNHDINSVASILEGRFKATHTVTYKEPTARSINDFEIVHPAGFDEPRLLSAMNEFRSQPQKWMHCVPMH